MFTELFIDQAAVKFDIVTKLPEEISEQIFRMLDARSLLSAKLVSKKWLKHIRKDKQLVPTKIRRKLRLQKIKELSQFTAHFSDKMAKRNKNSNTGSDKRLAVAVKENGKKVPRARKRPIKMCHMRC